MTSIISSGNAQASGARSWKPRPSRPSSVDPTAPELLAMASGTCQDWRSEPTIRDLRAADREVPALLAEFGALYMEQLSQLEIEGRLARATDNREWSDEVEQRIYDVWDSVGHLSIGT
ncbi:hypothetical protein SAMN05421630_11543 [Prauserella marina]|uniref:Uncharacterized protein n=1 Tax=Prauserella marina TaxID=530584 RepID=A0A1G6Z083_9PSEU|nr:hypothetical protein [Prauserella marina]PWV71353.1 hypothetical protein DES30_11269 [Prauserella marina]SDD95961.1 hypothetical protein SAMN05421630_11543 [Prauserella marina]